MLIKSRRKFQICIKNLDQNVEDDELHDILSVFGDVLNVQLSGQPPPPPPPTPSPTVYAPTYREMVMIHTSPFFLRAEVNLSPFHPCPIANGPYNTE